MPRYGNFPWHYLLILMAALPSVMGRVVASFYLINDASASPMTVSIYLNATTILGIIVTFVAGRGLIDRHNPGIVAFASLIFTLLNVCCLLFVPNAFYALIFAVFFGALGQLLVPSLFMLDERFRAGQPNSGSSMYHTRLVISVVWILGPPVSFYLYWLWGFSGIALVTTALVAASSVVILAFSPKTGPGLINPPEEDDTNPANALRFAATFFVMVMVTAANVLHAIVLPLFLTKVLGAPTYVPGWSMAAAAGMEVVTIGSIPMLLRVSNEENLLFAGLLLGVAYFMLLSLVTSPVIILLLQLLYGAHFALATVVCLGILRKHSRQKMGGVASQFVNAGKIGGLVGAGLFGLVAETIGLSGLLTQCALALVIIPTLTIAAMSAKSHLYRVGRST